MRASSRLMVVFTPLKRLTPLAAILGGLNEVRVSIQYSSCTSKSQQEIAQQWKKYSARVRSSLLAYVLLVRCNVRPGRTLRASCANSKTGRRATKTGRTKTLSSEENMRNDFHMPRPACADVRPSMKTARPNSGRRAIKTGQMEIRFNSNMIRRPFEGHSNALRILHDLVLSA